MKIRLPNHSRIILAIALKDIVQAIKDKIILGVIIGVFLLILPSQLLPLILQNESIPLAVIYSPEPLSLADDLAKLPDTSAFFVNSLEKLQDELASGRSFTIGLALPENFTEKVSSKATIQIDAFFPHWTKPEEIKPLVQHFEDKIHQLTESPIEITIIDDQVHPDEDTLGSQVMFILQMINAVMTIALVLVPQLIMVEKERHTLDALLVSPASLADLIIGKGLVGVFYASIAVLIVILLNTKFIAHWPLLLVSAFSGVTFAVLVGLLIGLIFNNFQQATLAMSIIVMIAIGPAFVKLIVTANLPRILDLLVNWLPSGQLADLLLMSLMKSFEIKPVLLGLGSIWAANFILFGINLWKIKQESEM